MLLSNNYNNSATCSNTSVMGIYPDRFTETKTYGNPVIVQSDKII